MKQGSASTNAPRERPKSDAVQGQPSYLAKQRSSKARNLQVPIGVRRLGEGVQTRVAIGGVSECKKATRAVPALAASLAQGYDHHLQEKEGDVDVLRLHESLPPRLRFVHSLGSGQVDLCASGFDFEKWKCARGLHCKCCRV